MNESNIIDHVDFLTFNLKLIGKKNKKNILISAGKLTDKKNLLPSIINLSKLNVFFFATKGTSAFLSENSIDNQEIYKIAEKKEPNIKSFLRDNRFDFIINILTGDVDYDEDSDCKLIRKLAIEKGIPLITDIDVAIMTIETLIKQQKDGIYEYHLLDKTEPWNLKKEFLRIVSNLGGFACHHSHLDKAYLISKENLLLGHSDMQKKWELYRLLKENYTYEDLVERISRGVEKMVEQGVVYLKSFVDADATVNLLPIKAALEVKEKYSDQIKFDIGVQPLEGVLDKKAQKKFTEACLLADFIGGLPSKDRPTPEKHLDYIMSLAKDLNKPLEVHVDQENNPYENETELLAVKTIEHGLEGKVNGIHAISVSAKSETDQNKILSLVKDAGIGIIICPSAAISMKQLNNISAPLHNSIGPFVKLLSKDIPVYLGADNIYDLFMPIVDGDMWFECRMLMESCRYYNLQQVAEVACRK